ncbi:hypothetical protein ACH429_15650 [Streptomyces pathocidini]|uniref:Secreted protein n=1 Tax=Streptomyces pathocidini TaxID=1650571 RepID=A0ABW7UUF3_9ACTN|nr:hypothetical protein [Streptomyces pathocidini]
MTTTMRLGLRVIRSIPTVALTAAIAFTAGGVAVADDELPADVEGTDTLEVIEITEPDQQLPTGDAVLGEEELSADDATSDLDVVDSRAAAKRLPYLCKAAVDYPHNSHTVKGTINVHFDTKCGQVAPNLYTEGSLSRSRWYGWEHLSTGKDGKESTRSLRVVAPKGCKKGTWYRYKGQARFYVSGPQGRGSAHVYNQNDKELKCTG